MIINGGQLKTNGHTNFGKFILHHLQNAKLQNVCLEHYNTGEQLTYGEFIKYAVSLSLALSELGVKIGDVVGVGSEQRIHFLPTTLAVVFTGATYTPFDLKTGTAVLNHKLNLSKPNYFICTALFWQMYRELIKTCKFIKTVICFDEIEDVKLSVKRLILRHEDVQGFEPSAVEKHDVAIILYSSGTTGMSKGVPVSHLGFIISSLPSEFQDECIKTTLSHGEWYHRYDICSAYANLAAGRKIVFATDLSSDIILKVIQECQVNSALLVPSLVSYLAETEEEEKYKQSSLKILYSTGAPLDANIIETVKTRLTNINKVIQSYGMTECGQITSECWCTKSSKPGSVGMAAPGMTLKVVHPETRQILGSNQRGEICIQGLAVTQGYLGANVGSHLDEQGFFATGDMGYYDENRYLYVVDRLKDIMFCNDGFEVSPLELESILQRHPGVREAGVTGRPAGVCGHAPAAFLVPRLGAQLSRQDILDYMSTQASPFMQLQGGVYFIPKLPRNAHGKLLRRQLREMLNEME